MLALASSMTSSDTPLWHQESCCGWCLVLQRGRTPRLCISRAGIRCHLETGRFARKYIRIWKGPSRDRSGDIPAVIVSEPSVLVSSAGSVAGWGWLCSPAALGLFGVLAAARIRGAMVTQHWGVRGIHTALAGSWKTFPKQLPEGVNSSFLCQGAICFGISWYYCLSGLVLLFLVTYSCICSGVLLLLSDSALW